MDQSVIINEPKLLYSYSSLCDYVIAMYFHIVANNRNNMFILLMGSYVNRKILYVENHIKHTSLILFMYTYVVLDVVNMHHILVVEIVQQTWKLCTFHVTCNSMKTRENLIANLKLHENSRFFQIRVNDYGYYDLSRKMNKSSHPSSIFLSKMKQFQYNKAICCCNTILSFP